MSGFLTSAKEREKYLNSRARIVRKAQPMGLSGEKIGAAIPVTGIFERALHAAKNKLTKSFCCNWISVDASDGISWTAEMINDQIKSYTRDGHDFDHRNLIGGLHEDYPEVAKMLGTDPQKGIGIMREMIITSSSRRKFPRLVAAAILTAIGAPIYQAILKPKELLLILEEPIWIGVLLVAIAILYLGIERLLRSTEDEGKILGEFYKLESTQSPKYFELVDKVSSHLPPSRFRVVIIDNYSEFDVFTRLVLERYMTNNTAPMYNEIWLVLDGDTSATSTFRCFQEKNEHNWALAECIKKFKLLNISEREKGQLIATYGLPHNENTVIKEIVGLGETNSSWNFVELHNHRQRLPRSTRLENSYELFYLLSFNSSPGNISLSKKYYTNELINRGPTRAKNRFSKSPRNLVLGSMIPLAQLKANQLTEVLQEIFITSGRPTFFSQYVTEEKSQETSRYRIHPQIKITLSANWQTLNLPKPQIAHVFWALFWGDKIAGFDRPIFYKKLSHHLLQSKGFALDLDQKEVVTIRKNLVHIGLDAVHGCLNSGLTEEIVPLIKYIHQLIFLAPTLTKEIDKLKAICWQYYAILNDNELIDLLCELNTYEHSEVEPKSIDMERFLATLNIKPSCKRNGLLPLSISTQYGNTDSTTTFFNIIEGTIQLNLGFASSHLKYLKSPNPFIHYITPNSFTFEKARYLLRQCNESLRSKNMISIIDVLNVCDALWNITLTMADKFDTSLLSNYLTIEDEIERSIAILKILKKKADTSYIAYPLVKDACANILMVITMLASKLTDPAINVKSRMNKLQDLVADLNRAASQDFVLVIENEHLSLNLLNSQILRLIDLTAIAWMGINLSHLSTKLIVKKNQFAVLFNQLDPHEITHAILPFRSMNSIFGLFSNLTVVLSDTIPRGLRAYYLDCAVASAQNGNMDSALVIELKLMMFSQSLAYPTITSKSLVYDGYLTSNLENLVPVVKEEYMMSFIYSRKLLEIEDLDSAIYTHLNTLIKKRCEEIKSVNLRNSLLAQLEAEVIVKQIKEDPSISVLGIQNSWRFSKKSEHYAWILATLVKKDKADVACYEEGIELVKANLENFAANHFIILAVELLKNRRYQYQSDVVELLIKYLDIALQNLHRLLTIDYIISVYKILLNTAKDSKYRKQINHWQILKFDLDELKLFRLITTGQAFEFFQYFANCLIPNGLKVDRNAAEMRELENKTALDIDLWIREITKGGKPILPFDPFAEEKVLSANFLLLGHFVFKSQANNESYSRLRKSLNASASQGIAILFLEMDKLTEIESDFREQVQKYRTRFENYDHPEDEQR